MTRVIIRHVSGTKQNQVEQFLLDGFSELSIGRDPSSSITYDPIKDDLVSRRHALIEIAREPELGFTISDRGSANGTFVNGVRLTAPAELLPTDTVSLGKEGPKFVFDVEPRGHLGKRTRHMSIGDAFAVANPTHVVITPPGAAEPAKAGIGALTLERKLGEERQRSTRVGAYALAAGILLVGVVGAVLYQVNRRTEDRVVAAIQETQQGLVETKAQVGSADQKLAETNQKLAQTQQALLSKAGRFSRQEIAARAAGSTVLIESTWRLYDRASGRQLFHRCRTVNNVCQPLFVRLQDGSIVRWLMTDDENQSNAPIAISATGSGFVVSKDGFILTNKHVASGWLVASGAGRYERDPATALVVPYGDGRESARPATPTEREAIGKLQRGWVPVDGAPLFRETRADLVSTDVAAFEGRADILDVRFPGNNAAVAAKFVRASNEADVALIKIDMPQPMRPLDLAAEDYVPPLGEPVTVIGYPAASDQTLSVQESNQGGVMRTSVEPVPEPTVADGVVSRIGNAVGGMASDPSITTVGKLGDVYQLSATAVGPGSSGGPVFAASGKVIGLMTYLVTGANGERIGYAVPIKYGERVMKLTRVTQ